MQVKKICWVVAFCALVCVAVGLTAFAAAADANSAPLLTEEVCGTVLAVNGTRFAVAADDADSLYLVTAASAEETPAVGDCIAATVQINPSGAETLLSCRVTGTATVEPARMQTAQSALAQRGDKQGGAKPSDDAEDDSAAVQAQTDAPAA